MQSEKRSLTSLTTQLKEREEEVNKKEAQLNELKNWNAALETQLKEYKDYLEQNQVKTFLQPAHTSSKSIEQDMVLYDENRLPRVLPCFQTLVKERCRTLVSQTVTVVYLRESQV